MSETTKRYLISSAITFLSAFVLAVTAMPINLDNMDKSAWIALGAVGLRAGVKALVEVIQSKLKK